MIRIQYRKKTDLRVKRRLKNKARIRKRVEGTSERPRFSVFRSGRHLYAQLIDDTKGLTLVAASTLGDSLGAGKANKDVAKQLGQVIAKKALSNNIVQVVFDRSGYVYHGKIRALAESARESGLNF